VAQILVTEPETKMALILQVVDSEHYKNLTQNKRDGMKRAAK